MTCETYRDCIAAHVDGDLPSPNARGRGHLAVCKNCSHLLADQQHSAKFSDVHWEARFPLMLTPFRCIAAESSPLQSCGKRHGSSLLLLQPASSACPGCCCGLVADAVSTEGSGSLEDLSRTPEQVKRLNRPLLDAALPLQAVKTGELPLAYRPTIRVNSRPL